MPLTDQEELYLSSLLEGLEPEIKALYPSAQSFVSDQVKRHDQYGQDTRVSPKQWRWLEDIYKQFVSSELPNADGPHRDDREDMAGDRDDNRGELPDDIEDEVPF